MSPNIIIGFNHVTMAFMGSQFGNHPQPFVGAPQQKKGVNLGKPHDRNAIQLY